MCTFCQFRRTRISISTSRQIRRTSAFTVLHSDTRWAGRGRLPRLGLTTVCRWTTPSSPTASSAACGTRAGAASGPWSPPRTWSRARSCWWHNIYNIYNIYITTISTISTGGLWLRPAAVSAVVPRPLGRGGRPPPPRSQVLGLQSSRLIIGQSVGLDMYTCTYLVT